MIAMDRIPVDGDVMMRAVEVPFPELPQLTEAERARTRAALERMRQRREALLKARGGRLFPEASEEIAAMRAERDAELP